MMSIDRNMEDKTFSVSSIVITFDYDYLHK